MPENITDDKFVEFMSKCGMIDIDVRSNKPKVKLYKDENGVPKGDGLCTYVKVESVQLALQVTKAHQCKGFVTFFKFQFLDS